MSLNEGSTSSDIITQADIFKFNQMVLNFGLEKLLREHLTNGNLQIWETVNALF